MAYGSRRFEIAMGPVLSSVPLATVMPNLLHDEENFVEESF